MDGYLVSDAATELGVSRQQVHRWIESGDMSTDLDSSGRHWVPAHEIEYRSKLPGERRRGRPPSQQTVWAEIFDIEASRDRSRIDRLRNRRWFSHRSIRHAGWAEPHAVERLKGTHDAMVGGIDSAARHHAPVMPDRGPWDVYFARSRLDQYSRRPLIRRPSARANLVLHFVDDDVLENARRRFDHVMPASVAWLDLADVDDRAAPEVWAQFSRRTR